MSEYKFKKGDRVVVARLIEEDIDAGIQIGDTGDVLEDNNSSPFVRMDKYNSELHDAGGRCEDGHGWSFSQDRLELELEPKKEMSEYKYKFKKGDRFVVARPDQEDKKIGIKRGDTGEVLQDNNSFPFVRMDKYNPKLKTTVYSCEDGHVWAFHQDRLEPEPKSEVGNEEMSEYKYKFKKGDRVVVARPDEDDIEKGIQKGDTGKVLQNNSKAPYVRMDKYNENLTLEKGFFEKGHAWAFSQDKLELESEYQVGNDEMNSTGKLIKEECESIKELLLSKNKAYGNSALEPLNIFFKGNAEDSIRVRLDDKLKRIANKGLNDDTEDTLQDLIGYLILLRISRKQKSNENID